MSPYIKKLKYLFLIFPCLFSCNPSSWEYNSISSEKNSNYSTLVYKKHGCFEIEFLNLNGKFRCYINMLDFKIKRESPISVSIISNGSEKKSSAYLRKGSNRLILEEEDMNLILSSLEKGLPLAIEIEGYREDIDPELFSKNYKKFQKHELITFF